MTPWLTIPAALGFTRAIAGKPFKTSAILLIVIFGTSGDFFESKLKREAGVKDSGNILPGHGGMLDRFDTVLFAVPVIFVWITLFGNI